MAPEQVPVTASQVDCGDFGAIGHGDLKDFGVAGVGGWRRWENHFFCEDASHQHESYIRGGENAEEMEHGSAFAAAYFWGIAAWGRIHRLGLFRFAGGR